MMKFYGIMLVVIGSLVLSGCAPQMNSTPVGFKSAGFKGVGFKGGRTRHGHYVVRKGDTIEKVAHRISYPSERLAKINHLDYPYLIFPGQILYFSEKSKSVKPLIEKKTSLAKGTNASHQLSSIKSNKNTKTSLNTNSNKNSKVNSKVISKQSTPRKVGPNLWNWPVHGMIVRNFKSANKGLDIAGKKGSPIYAASNGVVVFSGDALKGYGNFLIIKHDNDFLSAYAHNQVLMVKEGDRVVLGQEIAKMGQSDNGKVKLHFEIRHKGKMLDPLKFLPTI